jgi:DNA-binding MarR family transcriptional regulator
VRRAPPGHRFMQRLRGAGWVNASALPSNPGLVQKLLQKGWIETKSGPKTELLYRLTEEGLEARNCPSQSHSENRRTRTRPLAPSSIQAREIKRRPPVLF